MMGSLENVYISVDFGIKSDVFFHFWWVKTPALEAALADGKWKWYKTGLDLPHGCGSRTCHPTKTINFFCSKGLALKDGRV